MLTRRGTMASDRRKLRQAAGRALGKKGATPVTGRFGTREELSVAWSWGPSALAARWRPSQSGVRRPVASRWPVRSPPSRHRTR